MMYHKTQIETISNGFTFYKSDIVTKRWLQKKLKKLTFYQIALTASGWGPGGIDCPRSKGK